MLLALGSVASLAANVAVAEPTTTGRVIAARPSFALIAAYELLMRQVRRSATGDIGQREPSPRPQPARLTSVGGAMHELGQTLAGRHRPSGGSRDHGTPGLDLRRQAWQWAQANRAGDGSLPSGREIACQYGRHERWGRLVKRSGHVGEIADGGVDKQTEGDEQA